MKMRNKTYDILKWVALVVLPAICVLCSTVGEAWGFPNVTKVVTTIGAVDTFFGAVLGISSNKYKKNTTEE